MTEPVLYSNDGREVVMMGGGSDDGWEGGSDDGREIVMMGGGSDDGREVVMMGGR